MTLMICFGKLQFVNLYNSNSVKSKLERLELMNASLVLVILVDRLEGHTAVGRHFSGIDFLLWWIVAGLLSSSWDVGLPGDDGDGVTDFSGGIWWNRNSADSIDRFQLTDSRSCSSRSFTTFITYFY